MTELSLTATGQMLYEQGARGDKFFVLLMGPWSKNLQIRDAGCCCRPLTGVP